VQNEWHNLFNHKHLKIRHRTNLIYIFQSQRRSDEGNEATNEEACIRRDLVWKEEEKEREMQKKWLVM